MSATRDKPLARSKQLGFLQAINQAQSEEMERDERVILLGQDLRANVFGAADGALDRFRPARVRDLPLAEAASVGLCAGAAKTGLRPVLDLTVASFVFRRDGPVRLADRQDALHVRRPGGASSAGRAGSALQAGRHGRPPRRPAVPDVHERAGAEDRRPQHRARPQSSGKDFTNHWLFSASAKGR